MIFTDINQSKELFELGFPQDKAQYAWFEGALVPTINVRDNNFDKYGYNEDMERFIVACPTLGELIDFAGARFHRLSTVGDLWVATCVDDLIENCVDDLIEIRDIEMHSTPLEAMVSLVKSLLVGGGTHRVERKAKSKLQQYFNDNLLGKVFRP